MHPFWLEGVVFTVCSQRWQCRKFKLENLNGELKYFNSPLKIFKSNDVTKSADPEFPPAIIHSDGVGLVIVWFSFAVISTCCILVHRGSAHRGGDHRAGVCLEGDVFEGDRAVRGDFHVLVLEALVENAVWIYSGHSNQAHQLYKRD